jgi:ParB-like chromosome segregation protein Spo0J
MIEKVKIGEVKTNPNNPRLIKDDKFRKLVKSINEFPEMLQLRPIIVNNNMITLGGNMRLKACNEAGLKEVYIIKASNLNEAQQAEFIIKDNIGFGEWDWDIIANQYDEEELKDWGLDLPIFESESVDELQDENYIKISIEATNNAFIEMNEKLQNICDEYSAIMKVN